MSVSAASRLRIRSINMPLMKWPRRRSCDRWHARSHGRRGLPLFRSLAGGKAAVSAGRFFEGASPPPCGVLSRKSETRRAKRLARAYSSHSPGQHSGSGSARLDLSQKGDLPSSDERAVFICSKAADAR